MNVKGKDDELKFIFNAKNVPPTLNTISELGITDNAHIFILGYKSFGNIEISLKEEENINDRITVTFKDIHDRNHIMYFESNISIGLAIQKFLIRVGQKELISTHENKIAFLFNATRYRPNDTISLKSLFKGNQGTIIVNDINYLIGAGKNFS